MFASPGAIAFQIGPLVVRWYGILMATAIVLGLWLGHRQARKERLPADDIISAGQWAILAGLVGARLYEVAFNWDYYGQYPSKILAVWEGGLAMHGGLIVGPLVIGQADRMVRRIGWCSGGAQGYFEQAIALGVDAYLSGEISEQTVHLARESGVAYLAAGHHATERYGVQALAGHLAQQFGISCEFVDLDNPV